MTAKSEGLTLAFNNTDGAIILNYSLATVQFHGEKRISSNSRHSKMFRGRTHQVLAYPVRDVYLFCLFSLDEGCGFAERK